MSLKSKLGIIVLGCAVTGAVLLGFSQKETYSTEAVMESLWDEYGVQSTMIGDTNPILDVSVYDNEDIDEIESYLKNNLSGEDLNHYKLNVYEYSSNLLEFRDNAQKT